MIVKFLGLIIPHSKTRFKVTNKFLHAQIYIEIHVA